MKTTIECVLNDVGVACEGEIYDGCPDVYVNGNVLPGDKPSIENFKVFLVVTRNLRIQRLEITNFLSESEIESLEEQFISNQ